MYHHAHTPVHEKNMLILCERVYMYDEIYSRHKIEKEGEQVAYRKTQLALSMHDQVVW